MTDRTDNDQTPNEEPREADAPDGTTGDGGGRSRTRRRGGRGRRGQGARADGADGAASAERTDAPADDATRAARSGDGDVGEADSRSDDGSEARSGGDGSDGDGDTTRRRRRGRRGRGRGKGGGAGRSEGGSDAASSSDRASDDEQVDTSRDRQRDRQRDGARGEGGRRVEGRRGAADAAADGGDGTADGKAKGNGDQPSRSGRERDGGGGPASKADQDVAAAIAKGGTRMAAKGRGRSGGGGGGGGRGRGQRVGGVPEEVRRAILEGPPRTMLVTNREDRTQIAVLEDRTVVEHYVTRKKEVTFVGNIYMARVQNVLPGMEAAFLDIGKGRNGVLYAGEVLYDELDLEEGADQRIENVLKPGQKVLVQVTKDPMGSKGPRLTMHLSLAGRYSVLAPNSDLFGISRKLTDKERDRLRRIVRSVKPDHHGVIVRTAAENASEEQLTADLQRLLAKWEKVEEAADGAKAMTAVYEEPPLVVKVIRDNFGPEFERCIVDDEDLYHQVRGYLDEVAPELTGKVELYGQPTADARARAAGAPSVEEAAADPATADEARVEDAPAADDTADDTAGSSDTPDAPDAPATADGEDATPKEAPVDEAASASGSTAVVPAVVDLEAARARREKLPRLFDGFDVTDQLRKATSRKVWLPSGGYLIIESTEAMKVIDVNSGKFTGNGDMNLEEVVLRTNLEAADEIVRQLRLRDMGGIIVIDFIDMLLKANQDQVVRRLKRELLRDRTKTRVSEVSRLGLVQMTRKNVSQGLVEAFSHACEACEGRGLISELD
nr:ribonuclease E/G [Nitriliruptor alkaliphilus]